MKNIKINVMPRKITDNIIILAAKPKSNILRIFFISLQVIFSYDFGFITSIAPHHRVIVKAMTSVSGIGFRIVCFILFAFDMEYSSIVWYSKYICENVIHILILSLTQHNKSLCFFLEFLQSIDNQLGVDYSFRLNFIIITSCLSAFIFKISLSVIYCTKLLECPLSNWAQYLYIAPFLSLDVPLIILFIIFYATKYRLEALRKFIEGKTYKPKDLQYFYRSLINATETIKKACDPVFIVTLGVNIPSLMMMTYEIIREIKMSIKPPIVYVTEIITLIAMAVIIFAPAVSASLLSAEVDNIKVVLHNMILDETDKNQLHDLKRFIYYLQARPFKFRLLKIIPMDATLPTMSINLCITYVIVMLQITHLY